MDIESPATLKNELTAINGEAEKFFTKAESDLLERYGEQPLWKTGAMLYWADLPPETQEFGVKLRSRLAHLAGTLLAAAKTSSLVGYADRDELRLTLRQLLAALYLKRYKEQAGYVISQEDQVFGYQPPEHQEYEVWPTEVAKEFGVVSSRCAELIELIVPEPANIARAIVASEPVQVRKYRPNTAFIMMWISDEHPELEDVKNCFKDVCKQFGINAVRSDEIEHEDVITKRILDEIATSEFLIADLSGERPSVYYEVGYAHAVGKRPILYRRKGTPLHFDLSVHNVPEYENITDLRSKLIKRLATVTNRGSDQYGGHSHEGH